MNQTAIYLYTLIRPAPPESASARLADIRGVADTPVRVVEEGGLAAVVGTVSIDEFGEQVRDARLEDLQWLERTARQHDAVVRASVDVATTIPLRLGTVFTDEAALRGRLAELHDSALRVLDRLDGREEWGVQLFVPRSAAEAPATGEPDPRTPTSGRNYLLQRRDRLAGRAAALEAARIDAEKVAAALEELADETRRHTPHDPRLSGHPRGMLVNAAYLVRSESVTEFRTRVGEYAADRGPGDVVLTGPWPPYSFADLAGS